ncbi:unnamed protein product, partial [Mesorhabditis spiculigera]
MFADDYLEVRGIGDPNKFLAGVDKQNPRPAFSHRDAGSQLYPGLTHANLCEHLTADTLRQPGWLDHPNGVIAFGRLVGVVTDFDAAGSCVQQAPGAENVRRESDRIWLNFGEGADIELITPAESAQRGDADSAWRGLPGCNISG